MRNRALLLAAVLALATLAYAPSLGGDFVWDDRPLILDDPQIRGFGNLPRLFARDFFAPGADDFEYGYYRPLITASYLLDWALWRDRPFGYRLTNLLWHLLATALLYFWLRRLVPEKSWAALLGATLFGLHPIHVESVAWIAGRTDVLCAAFALASLLAWQVYLERNGARLDFAPAEKNKRPRRTALGLYLFAGLMFLFSLLAKEMGVVALPIFVAAAWLAAERKPARLKMIAPELAGMLAALALYLALRVGVAGVTTGVSAPNHTWWKALFTFPGALAVYLGKLAFPLRQSGYLVRPYQTQPFTAWGIAGLLLLAGLILLAWRARNTAPLVAVSAACLLLSFAPLANLLRISGPRDMGFVMAERFLYLPSALMCLLIVAGAVWLTERRPTLPRRALIAIVVVIGVGLGVRTALAARVWTDEGRVYEQALSIEPDAPLLWTNLGAYYRRHGRLVDALAALRRAEQINQRLQSADWVSLYNNLGTALASEGKLGDALAYFDQALQAGGQEDRVQFNRGEALRLLGRTDEALAAYDASLRSNSEYLDPRLRRAQLLFAKNDLDGAERELREVLRREPREPDALANLGMLLRRRGKLADAAAALRQSLSLKADNFSALMALGGVAGQQERFADAAAAFEQAMRLAPNDPRPVVALAAALFRLGDRERAKALLDDAYRRFPDQPDVLVNLMHYYYETGDLARTRELLARALAVAPNNPEVQRYRAALGAAQ
jgi:tetratricopeptide (TPR) repeat protein